MVYANVTYEKLDLSFSLITEDYDDALTIINRLYPCHVSEIVSFDVITVDDKGASIK